MNERCDLVGELRKWLDSQPITRENIGDIRLQCFLPWDSEWNAIVRDETASRENGGQTIPTGYAETMDKLKRPDNWDVPGLIADIADELRRESDNGAALAVIDTLSFRMRDIAGLISSKHAKRIDANTIREAAAIAETFCDQVQQPAAVWHQTPAYEYLARYFIVSEERAGTFHWHADKILEHFNERGELRGDGNWRIKEIYDSLRAIQDADKKLTEDLTTLDSVPTQPAATLTSSQ